MSDDTCEFCGGKGWYSYGSKPEEHHYCVPCRGTGSLHPKFKSAKKFRLLQWEEDTNRLELTGVFTANDLRSMAAWLEDPKHPVVSPSVPFIDVELSNL